MREDLVHQPYIKLALIVACVKHRKPYKVVKFYDVRSSMTLPLPVGPQGHNGGHIGVAKFQHL
jgi:hypothetical protein